MGEAGGFPRAALGGFFGGGGCLKAPIGGPAPEKNRSGGGASGGARFGNGLSGRLEKGLTRAPVPSWAGAWEAAVVVGGTAGWIGC